MSSYLWIAQHIGTKAGSVSILPTYDLLRKEWVASVKVHEDAYPCDLIEAVELSRELTLLESCAYRHMSAVPTTPCNNIPF